MCDLTSDTNSRYYNYTAEVRTADAVLIRDTALFASSQNAAMDEWSVCAPCLENDHVVFGIIVISALDCVGNVA